MSNEYTTVPNSISYNTIVEKGYTLSASQYMELKMPNKKFLFVKDFLSRKLLRQDLGKEVGSLNYIEESTHYFVRTKALQSHSFLPEISIETALPIMPYSFVNMNLKEGNILISKDSNIGEVVILDKDYPNYMLSGAIYRLPVLKNKYYLLSFIKHSFFREQLNFMVPKGATIRHAKTLFLDCKIPMPNYDIENSINFVEVLTQAIINKEKLIKKRHKAILIAIENELLENQNPNKFSYELPKINELEEISRFDTGMYSESFKNIEFLINNYKNGHFRIIASKLKSGNTPSVRFIGNIKELIFQWVTPTNCTDYGVINEERINFEGKNNINEDCILLVNRTSKGGKGEFVGIASYYDYKELGAGHHNQGMYQVTGYQKEELIFMLCFLNCDLMRKYCSYMSAGSKMKELKMEQFLQIPFPKFDKTKQDEIAKLYYNSEIMYRSDTFTLVNFLENDNEYNQQAGIYELDKTAKYLKEILNQTIDKIINDKEIEIKFELI